MLSIILEVHTMPNTHVYPERYPQSNRPPGKCANLVGRILRTLGLRTFYYVILQ